MKNKEKLTLNFKKADEIFNKLSPELKWLIKYGKMLLLQKDWEQFIVKDDYSIFLIDEKTGKPSKARLDLNLSGFDMCYTSMPVDDPFRLMQGKAEKPADWSDINVEVEDIYTEYDIEEVENLTNKAFNNYIW